MTGSGKDAPTLAQVGEWLYHIVTTTSVPVSHTPRHSDNTLSTSPPAFIVWFSYWKQWKVVGVWGGRSDLAEKKGVSPQRSTLFLHALRWVWKNVSIRTAVVAIHCVSYDFRRDFVDIRIDWKALPVANFVDIRIDWKALPVATHWFWPCVYSFFVAENNLNAGETSSWKKFKRWWRFSNRNL